MRLNHLIDFFDRYIRGSDPALVHDDGFRRWTYSHDQLRAAAEAFARRLADSKLQLGDRLLIWSESRATRRAGRRQPSDCDAVV
jgi:hypothetical protein